MQCCRRVVSNASPFGLRTRLDSGVTAVALVTALRLLGTAGRPTQPFHAEKPSHMPLVSLTTSPPAPAPAPAAMASSHRYASHRFSKPTAGPAGTDGDVAASEAHGATTPTTITTAASDSSDTMPSTASSPATPQPHQHMHQRRLRTYTPSTEAADLQVQHLKRELLHTRLRLAKAEETSAALYEGVLSRLGEADRAAQLTATNLRYTGMALRCAHDNLEVELRRLLTIGLTAEEVDAAALEAGARQYVRQNIGFHERHVANAPSSVPNVETASRKEHEPAKWQPLR